MKHVNLFLLAVFLLTVCATSCLAEEKKDTIGIMKFNVSGNLDPALEIFLYDSLMDKMVASGKYTVVHWKKIESTLDDIKRFRPRISREATQKQAIKKLGLLKIYTGSLSKVGTNYFLAVNVLNPALLVERTVRDSVKSEDELDSLVDLIARLLLVTPEEAERLRAEEEARAAKKKKAKERKMLEEERLRLEEERGIEIDRDGRFIAYSKGIVVDSETGFMWAAEDNGYEIGWDDARTYCESYRGAGYKDWRMPTLNELAGLYGTGEGYVPMDGSVDEVEISGLIRLTSWWVWSSETRDSDAAAFNFCPGNRDWYRQTFSGSVRALPVRTGK
jgi:hypothetical protein